MGNLTTLAEVKTALSITDNVENDALNSLIAQTSAAIEEYCDRTFGQNTYTEYLCGDGRPFITATQRPIRSITSLYLDDAAYWGQAPIAFPSTTLLVQGTDYALKIDQPDGSSRCGEIYKISGNWDVIWAHTPGLISPDKQPIGNIKITYVAGYPTVPANVSQAAIMAISRIRNTIKYGQAIHSERYEEYEISFAPVVKEHIFSPEVRSLLSRYRNIAVG